VTVPEFALLCTAFGKRARELLPTRGSIQLPVTDRALGVGTLRDLFSNKRLKAAPVGFGDTAPVVIGTVVDPPSRSQAQLAEKHDAKGEAELKAARALGLAPLKLVHIAHRLWGRTLTAERERRLAERLTSTTSARAAQAMRGHITRSLLAELRHELGLPQDDSSQAKRLQRHPQRAGSGRARAR
jgi:hypothetical protein